MTTKKEKYDSFQNLLTGLGTRDDKRMSTGFRLGADDLLRKQELENLYYGDGLARIIVDTLPEEMLSKGWKVETPGDSAKEVQDALFKRDRALRFDRAVMKALRYAELYGGGAILLGVDDGVGDPAQPVNTDGIKAIRYAVPLSGHQLRVQEVGRDPLRSNFDRPTKYIISAAGENAGQMVDASRVLHFDGKDLPTDMDNEAVKELRGYGVSVLQLAYGPLRNLVSSFDNLATMVHEYNQAVFQIEGLMQLIAEGEDGYAVVRDRLRLMNMSRSVVNALLLAEGENFETKSLDLRGLAEIMDKFMLHLSAVTKMPVTKLMGQSPSGFSATGESDENNWYKFAASQQEWKLRDPLEMFYGYQLRAMEVAPRFSLEFFPLKEMSEKEEAELRKMHADTDNIYLTHSVLFPEEVAQSRFSGEEYGTDIQLDNESRLATLPLESDFSEETQSTIEETEEAVDSAKLVAIVSGVKDGTIPAESAIEILSVSFPSIPRERISAMVLPAANGSGNQAPGTTGEESPNAGDDVSLEDDATLPADAKSAKEVARILGFSSSKSITRLHQLGKIKMWKLGGRYLVSESEVQKAILQGAPEASTSNVGSENVAPDSADSD